MSDHFSPISPFDPEEPDPRTLSASSDVHGLGGPGAPLTPLRQAWVENYGPRATAYDVWKNPPSPQLLDRLRGLSTDSGQSLVFHGSRYPASSLVPRFKSTQGDYSYLDKTPPPLRQWGRPLVSRNPGILTPSDEDALQDTLVSTSRDPLTAEMYAGQLGGRGRALVFPFTYPSSAGVDDEDLYWRLLEQDPRDLSVPRSVPSRGPFEDAVDFLNRGAARRLAPRAAQLGNDDLAQNLREHSQRRREGMWTYTHETLLPIEQASPPTSWAKGGSVSADDVYAKLRTQATDRYHLPPGMLTWQLHQESGFNPTALGPPTSHGRAEGYGQFMPATAAEFHIDPWDPAQAIDAAARYDRQLYDQTGSWHAALDRYGTTLGLRGAPDPELHRQVADVLRGDGIDEPYSLTPGRLASYPESTQARVARLFRVMQLMDMLDPDNIDRDPLTGSQGDDQT